MDFGIMFFSSAAQEGGYGLLREASHFADRHGFTCVWTPERHFHAFGGLYPNPAVVGAGIATMTENLQIRAGSLISPLHHTVRIAEDWAVVDNLSGGRVAVSFGSGWNVDDFVFFPERYERRQEVMYRQIETVRSLWRGEEIVRENSFGKPVSIRLYPRPVQAELPVWVTSSGNVETCVSAGRIGANLLTHLIAQDLPTLAGKIREFRRAREEAHGDRGTVSLMLHTFLGRDLDEVRERTYRPFREYLRSAVSLERLAAEGGGAISGGHRIEAHEISDDAMEDLLDLAYERYFATGSLMGTPESCAELVQRLEEQGVDEIACLVDFIDDPEAVMESLVHLDELRARFSTDQRTAAGRAAVETFMDPLEE